MDARAVFIEVVERGSFRAAAEFLGISLSYASRRVKSLEEELGVQLLARTTRRVEPTPQGRDYHARVAPLIRGLNELDREMAEGGGDPRGTIRVAAPLSFGLSTIQPLVQQFLCRWRQVSIDISFSDRRVDPLDYDVAIRGGVLEDSSLVARKLVDLHGVVAASPGYLSGRSVPAEPADLQDHDAVEYTGYRTIEGWRFGDVRVRPKARFFSDNGDALVLAAEAGLGVVYQPDFLVRGALERGTLVPVLQGVETWSGAFWAITRTSTRTTAVQAFVDDLAEGCQAGRR